MTEINNHINESAIAIIGMACRFPLGSSPQTYWENLREGNEAIRRVSERELLEAGVSQASLSDKNYVPSASIVEGIECFDAEFFGFGRREAEILDPQQRFLLECAYHALEQAGYASGGDTHSTSRNVGVYVGAATSSYAYQNLLTDPDLVDAMGVMNLSIGNEKDFVAAQLAYRLNLNGPAVNVNTACSTSLVAVHHAVASLLNYECDMAIAGGATVRAQQHQGYFYSEGGILSADGHCRPFSADSDGTIDGNGAGVVLLKRLEDAIEAGDHIHAVIESSAINNDGSDKMGITAPSVKGQARVIHEAISLAEISASDLGYIEAHGTGTKIGDPIEIAALKEAFTASMRADSGTQFCAIGSVKSNMGHLDAAAGIAGLIKAALAVEHAEIPPSLHAVETNPAIDFESSPFYVSSALQSWESADGKKRLAGVSSFGIGGTNAHLILGQAPKRVPPSDVKQSTVFLLPVSARTGDGLMTMIANLEHYLTHSETIESHSISVGDVCRSLCDRPSYQYRYVALVTSLEDALEELQAIAAGGLFTGDVSLLNKACIERLAHKQDVLLKASSEGEEYNERVSNLCDQANRWLHGEPLDLSNVIDKSIYRKVMLPGYAFVKERFWVEPAQPLVSEQNYTNAGIAADGALADHEPRLHCYEWRSRPLVRNTQRLVGLSVNSELGAQLVFCDKLGVANAHYQDNEGHLSVSHSDRFSQTSKSSFELDIGVDDHLDNLTTMLREQDCSIELIECFTFLDIPEQVLEEQALSQALLDWQKSLLRIVEFVKECGRNKLHLPLLRVYFNNAFSVTGDEKVSLIARALTTMLVVINQELAKFRLQVIDVEKNTGPLLLAAAQAHVQGVYAELNSHSRLTRNRDEVFYAIRGKKLWSRFFRHIDSVSSNVDSLDQDSTVVFIGGLGQVGQEASKHISMLCKHLVIVGRKEESHLDDSAKAALKRMRMLNSQVEYKSVDISDSKQLCDCLSEVNKAYGKVDLVIHGAGDMNYQSLCSHDQSNTQDLYAQHHAKVRGSLNLLNAAKSIDIDNIVATSSLSASLGGLGLMSYAAANAVMDALAEHTELPCNWYSIDLDGLVGVKSLGDQNSSPEASISTSELVELITYLLNRHDPGLWVYANGDLNERWQRSTKKVSMSSAEGLDGDLENIADEEVEPELIALYENLTGHQGIQAEDNFFAIGGDSVTATQLRMLIEQKFSVDISIEAIFDHPVVSELSAYIKTLRDRFDEADDELAKLLEAVAEMDEVDTERLLKENS